MYIGVMRECVCGMYCTSMFFYSCSTDLQHVQKCTHTHTQRHTLYCMYRYGRFDVFRRVLSSVTLDVLRTADCSALVSPPHPLDCDQFHTSSLLSCRVKHQPRHLQQKGNSRTANAPSCRPFGLSVIVCTGAVIQQLITESPYYQ